MDCAKRLFEEQGFEETTMAAIAEAANVSTPTVFNYYGTRNQLLLAIILEGHNTAVSDYHRGPKQGSSSLSDDLCALLSSYTRRSLEIFSKSVWRYADSTVIREPASEFVQQYSQIDKTLTRTIEDFLRDRPCTTRRGNGFDAASIASIIYNHWNAHYTAYIKDDEMSLETHLDALLPSIKELLDLIFENA